MRSCGLPLPVLRRAIERKLAQMSIDQDSAMELLSQAAEAAAAARNSGLSMDKFVVGRVGSDPDDVRRKLEARRRMLDYAKG